MTTLAGYNLINHSGKYIEKAPDEFEPLKTIYINKRDEELKRGMTSGTIWMVRDTVQKTMRINKTELSNILTTLSMYLIIHYPLEYLRSVWASIRILFIVPDEDFRIVNNSFSFRVLLPLYQAIIGFGLISGIILTFSTRKIVNYNFHLLMFILIITNLLASSLFDYGSNGRFFAPTYFILFIWTSAAVLSFQGNLASNVANTYLK